MTQEAVGPPPSGMAARFAGYARDALRYWEPRRAVYNLALAVVVVSHLFAASPAPGDKLGLDLLLVLFFLAVLANICYCAVYPVDLFVQFAGIGETWRRGRIALLLVGTAFAGVITHFFAAGMFGRR